MSDTSKLNETILIVDDAQIARDIMRLFLEHGGYTVIEAADGKEAIVQYTRMNPALVILDIIMPQIDGITALKKIKKINPKAKILICTATDDYRVIDLAMKDGASGYIIKPYNGLEFLKVVTDILA